MQTNSGFVGLNRFLIPLTNKKSIPVAILVFSTKFPCRNALFVSFQAYTEFY